MSELATVIHCITCRSRIGEACNCDPKPATVDKRLNQLSGVMVATFSEAVVRCIPFYRHRTKVERDYIHLVLAFAFSRPVGDVRRAFNSMVRTDEP